MYSKFMYRWQWSDKRGMLVIPLFVTKCSIFLNSSTSSNRCLNCEKHCKTLWVLASKKLKHQDVDKTAPENHVNYRFLSPSEEADQFHSQQWCNLWNKADRLKKLEKAIEVCGMSVDDELHSDLKSMIEDSSANIKMYHLIFWKQQQAASKLSCANVGNLCQYHRHLSGKAWDSLIIWMYQDAISKNTTRLHTLYKCSYRLFYSCW